MPELPEVETTKRGIEPHLVGKQIIHVSIRQWQLRWPIPRKLPTVLKNQFVLSLYRRGKYILFEFAHGYLMIHLGMSGRLHILEQPSTKPTKHDHVDFKLNNQTLLRYTDPRKFGAILWTNDDPKQHPLLINLGPEPLSLQFHGRYLKTACQKRKQSIKQTIMDNKILVGVGNIYASESLYAAKINPLRKANTLTNAEYQLLTKAIKITLRKAIKAGGTTLKDFLKADGKPGYFRNELQVYGREQEPCYQCETPISATQIGQRNTFYCQTCQC